MKYRIFLLTVHLVVSLVAGQAYGDTAVAVALAPARAPAAAPWTDHVVKPFTDAFDRTGLIITGVGTAATLVAFSFDVSMHDAWSNHQRMSSEASHFGDLCGQGWVEAGVGVGQVLFDRVNGWPAVESMLAANAVSYALKYTIARPRPDSTTLTSFPSGHTTASFAMASELLKSYGWFIGGPAFALGVYTGLSRLADDAHWFSDVVAGATIGTLFGRGAFRHHYREQQGHAVDGEGTPSASATGPDWQFIPTVSANTWGLTFEMHGF